MEEIKCSMEFHRLLEFHTPGEYKVYPTVQTKKVYMKCDGVTLGKIFRLTWYTVVMDSDRCSILVTTEFYGVPRGYQKITSTVAIAVLGTDWLDDLSLAAVIWVSDALVICTVGKLIIKHMDDIAFTSTVQGKSLPTAFCCCHCSSG